MKLCVYLAQKMTGRTCLEIIKEARKVTRIFKKHGLDIWSPAIAEKIPNVKKKLNVLSKEDLLSKWMIDKKEGLRNCHIFYDVTGDLHSEGTNVERGYMRWYLWRPSIRCRKPDHIYSISDIEDDFIANSHVQAAIVIRRLWGSRKKWILWKISHILYGLPKMILIQLKSLFL